MLAAYACLRCRYKYYTRPLVADDVYHSLLEDVEAFRTGPGPELQRVLTEWDKVSQSVPFGSCLTLVD